MIPPSEIARLAHRQGLGDKTMELDDVLTWVLQAIANSPLPDRPHLDTVIRETNRWLRQSGLP
jgi:hypothetical protein